MLLGALFWMLLGGEPAHARTENLDTPFFSSAVSGFRFYDPNMQRWLNRDPLVERGGLNLYAFLENDSISYVDIDGREKFGVAVRIGGMGIKVVKEISKDLAILLFKKEGKDIVCSKSQAKKWCKKKGSKISRIEKHGDEPPHGHPPDRQISGTVHGGHSFINTISSFTAVGVFGDGYIAQAVDFFNPVSDVVDAADLIDGLTKPSEESAEHEETCDDPCS